MDKIQKPDQYLHDGYYGKILSGDYSHQLKKHLAECIESFRAYDELGSPTIPYMRHGRKNKILFGMNMSAGNL